MGLTEFVDETVNKHGIVSFKEKITRTSPYGTG